MASIAVPAQSLLAEESKRWIAVQANRQSPFLKKFPGEIRNRIYELLFDEDEIVDIHGGDYRINHEFGGWTQGDSTRPARYRTNAAAITQTCQQLRQETLTMFYQRSTFLICLQQDEIMLNWPVQSWLRSLDDDALAALRHVLVRAWSYEHWAMDRDSICIRVVKLDLVSGAFQHLMDMDNRCGCVQQENMCSDPRTWRGERKPKNPAPSKRDQKMEMIMRLLHRYWYRPLHLRTKHKANVLLRTGVWGCRCDDITKEEKRLQPGKFCLRCRVDAFRMSIE